MRWSLLILSPISAPPWRTVSTLGFIPFFLKTSPIIWEVARVTSDEAGAPFQVIVSPQMSPMAAFQAKTALGKLKAVITPTVPRGFQTSIIKWSFLSELNTCPLNKKVLTRWSSRVHRPYHKYQWFIAPLQVPLIISYPSIKKPIFPKATSLPGRPHRFAWLYLLGWALELRPTPFEPAPSVK